MRIFACIDNNIENKEILNCYDRIFVSLLLNNENQNIQESNTGYFFINENSQFINAFKELQPISFLENGFILPIFSSFKKILVGFAYSKEKSENHILKINPAVKDILLIISDLENTKKLKKLNLEFILNNLDKSNILEKFFMQIKWFFQNL